MLKGLETSQGNPRVGKKGIKQKVCRYDVNRFSLAYRTSNEQHSHFKGTDSMGPVAARCCGL